MMHLFIVSASAWFGHGQACTDIAHRLLTSSSTPAQTLVIDLATVQRENPQSASNTEIPVPASMRSWIDHFFLDQPMLDVERVHRAAQAICVEGSQVAVIDASALDVGLIDRTMNQLRIAFYGCAHWPGTLILVVDDAILHDVAGFASRVFFIQPDVTGQARINALLRNIKRFSKMEGLSVLGHKFLNSLNRWINSSPRNMTATEEK